MLAFLIVAALVVAANVVALITGLVIPIAVEAVTKVHASASIKNATVMFLAAVAALITRSVVRDTGDAVLTGQVVFDWFLSTAVAILGYLGIWKPLGLKGKIAPDKGLG